MCDPGYVYILSNNAMPGLVKIGRSINGGRSRATQIYQTGVPLPFKLEFELFTPDPHELESLVHEELYQLRVNSDREFFKVDVIDAIKCVMNIYGSDRNLTTTWADFVPDDARLRYLDYLLSLQGIRLNPPDIFQVLNELNHDDLTDALIRYFTRVQNYRDKYKEDRNG